MKNRRKKSSGIRLPLLTAAFFLAFVLLVNSFWPRGREVLRQVLFPADTSTMQAVEAFADELRYGVPFADAVEGFCREIIAEAEIAAD